MPSYQAPRGTRDLLPEEAAAMDALHAVVQARAERYGYPRISTPIIENREVFVKGVGEGSDIVGYEMYEVGQRGEGGLTLRPEGTAAVVRALLENGLQVTATDPFLLLGADVPRAATAAPSLPPV